MEETISLNKKEQRRVLVLNRVIAGQLTAEGAAELLELSERQIWRILAAYREEGAAALVHGNRDREPANAMAEGVRKRVVALAGDKYEGFNHQHLTERLNEEEGIALSRSSVRRILLEAGLKSPRKRRAPKHRSRRERHLQEGMLLQIDGSRHDWLEGRGPYLTLVGGIDDATGTVPFALFREQEDAHGYFLLMRAVVLTKGRPLAVYRDGHSIFEPSRREPLSLEEQLKGRPDPTQFGRLLEELEIASIAARSPQAKGRIERLWGTFQDRLVAELRQAGACTLEEANWVLWQFLPGFNRRFAVPPAQEGTAYRPLPEGVDPDTLFCFKYLRVVAPDNVVGLGEHRLQLLPSPERASYARAEVEIQERLDGSLAVYCQGQQLASKEAPAEAPVLRARKGRRGGNDGQVNSPFLSGETHPLRKEGSPPVGRGDGEGRKSNTEPPVRRRPAPNHPWRRPFRGGVGTQPQGDHRDRTTLPSSVALERGEGVTSLASGETEAGNTGA